MGRRELKSCSFSLRSEGFEPYPHQAPPAFNNVHLWDDSPRYLPLKTNGVHVHGTHKAIVIWEMVLKGLAYLGVTPGPNMEAVNWGVPGLWERLICLSWSISPRGGRLVRQTFKGLLGCSLDPETGGAIFALSFCLVPAGGCLAPHSPFATLHKGYLPKGSFYMCMVPQFYAWFYI